MLRITSPVDALSPSSLRWKTPRFLSGRTWLPPKVRSPGWWVGCSLEQPRAFAPSVNCLFSWSRCDGFPACWYWLNVIVMMRCTPVRRKCGRRAAVSVHMGCFRKPRWRCRTERSWSSKFLTQIISQGLHVHAGSQSNSIRLWSTQGVYGALVSGSSLKGTLFLCEEKGEEMHICVSAVK